MKGEQDLLMLKNYIPIMSAYILCLDKLVKLGKGRNLQKTHGKIKTCVEPMYSLAFSPFVGIVYEDVLCINSYILTYIVSPMVLKGKLGIICSR